jgi:hypothetical protein
MTPTAETYSSLESLLRLMGKLLKTVSPAADAIPRAMNMRMVLIEEAEVVAGSDEV